MSNGNGPDPDDYPGPDPAPADLEDAELAADPWKDVPTQSRYEAARWWHPDHRLYVVIRRGMDEGSEPDWFSVFIELPNGDVVSEEDSAPQERNAHRAAVQVLRRLAGDLPESVGRGIERTLSGTEATATNEGDEWPGAENPRRSEAFQDLQTYGQNYEPEHVIEAALADSQRDAYVGFDQRDFGLFQSAVDNFGIEFVIDAVFSVVEGDRPKVDGKTAAEWKREAGSGRPDESTLPVYPESELPREVNGWQLVGTRPSRVVYKAPEPHPAYDDGRRLYLESTQVQAPAHRRQESNQHPWGIRRESRRSDWTHASHVDYVASLLDSQDEAVNELLAYMEKWPPRPLEGPSPSEWPTQLDFVRTVHVALQDVLEAGEYGTDRPVDAIQQRIDAFRQDFDRGGKLLTPDSQQLVGDQRLRSGKQLTLVFGFLKMLHPEALATAREKLDAGDVGKLPFEQTRGEWQGSLSPDESGPSGTQMDLSGGAEGETPAGPRRAESVREDPERGQRTLGAAGEKDLREFGEGGESAQEAAERRKRRREERRRREVEAKRKAGSQVDLTGEAAGDREATRKAERARRAESGRPEEGLTSWVGPDESVDVDEDDDVSADFETGGADRPDAGGEDDGEREWSGHQKRSVADADYFALHYHGGVSSNSTNLLLNKFQSAARVINWAKKKPNRLLDMGGIGQRTVDRLADLDPAEAIKTPRERGTREDTLRKHDKGPEGEGLAGFEDVPQREQEKMERKREDAERRKASAERELAAEKRERREEYARQASTGNYELLDALDVSYWWAPKDGFEGRRFAVKRKRVDDPESWDFDPPTGTVPGYQSTFEEAVDKAERWMGRHPAEPEGGAVDDVEAGAEGDQSGRTVVLVGCGSEKADTARAAKELYTSNYFQLKRQYAEQFGDDWYILSAKHSLLDPDAEIAPYDKNLGELSQGERGKWAFRVRDDLEAEFDEAEDLTFVLLAGKDYTDELWPHIDALGWDVVRPLQTNDLGGIGEQMSWLKEQVSAGAPAVDVDVDESVEERWVDVNAGDVVADSSGTRYVVERTGPKSDRLGAVVELRSEETGHEQTLTANEMQTRFRHSGWEVVDEPEPADDLVTVDGEASHGKDAWSVEVPEQVGPWEFVESRGGDRIMWAAGGRTVRVVQTRDGWYATWGYRGLPGGVTTDGVWDYVDLATGEHTDRDTAEKMPLDDALDLALEVLREMEPAELTHPEFPSDIPVYLPPDEGDTVLDMPTYRHREFDAPPDAFRLEHVGLSKSSRRIRWERDPDVLEDEWSKETIEAVEPKGRTKAGWTLRYVRVHDDGTTTNSPETIQDWNAEEWVDLSESASRQQAYFGAAELAEMALARETPADDSAGAGAGQPEQTAPPLPDGWREVGLDGFAASREGIPERSFVGPPSDRGSVPHLDVYREGTDYGVKKVWRVEVGGAERSSVWLPTDESGGERFDTVSAAVAFLRQHLAQQEAPDMTPDVDEPSDDDAGDEWFGSGPTLEDIENELADELQALDPPRKLAGWERVHSRLKATTEIPDYQAVWQSPATITHDREDAVLRARLIPRGPEPENWWFDVRIVAYGSKGTGDVHADGPYDTAYEAFGVARDWMQENPADEAALVYAGGDPRELNGWSLEGHPDRGAERVYVGPAGQTLRVYHDHDEQVKVIETPAGVLDTTGNYRDALRRARRWMLEHPPGEFEADAGGDDVGGWPSAVAYLREHYGESYEARGEFTSDLMRFASEEGVDLPNEAGNEGVTQPLLRYQSIPADDVARQIENKVGEDTAAAVQEAIVAFATAGASRYDNGAATDGGRRVDGRDQNGAGGNGMDDQSRSRWQRLQDEAHRVVEDLGVGPDSLPSERERQNGEDGR